MDFACTYAQVDRAINCALCYTNAMAMYGVKVCTSPNLPNNEGAWRPITLKAPEGSIVNPQFPAPGGSRMLIGHYVPMLVFGCLGQVVPERVMAACGSPMWGMNQSGVRDDGRVVSQSMLGSRDRRCNRVANDSHRQESVFNARL